MEHGSLRLRHQSVALRLALSLFLLIITGGYACALFHIWDHHGKKDDEKGLSVTDLIGFYAGIERKAPLLRILDDPGHAGRVPDLTAPEAELLKKWLSGSLVPLRGGEDPIHAGYEYLPDDAPDDALSPADVLDERCNRCHAPGAQLGEGIGDRIPLNNLPSLKSVAYSKKLTRITPEILAASTHAHALGIAPYALLVCLLFLATAWPAGLRNGVVLLCFLGLFIDLASMWLARIDPVFVWVMIGGGALHGLALGFAILASLVDLWLLPARR